MTTDTKRNRPKEGKICLDSVVQIQHAIYGEIEEWLQEYNMVATYDEKVDLALSIFEELDAGAVIPPSYDFTREEDIEHFNDVKHASFGSTQ